jgi:hypothetical protein
MAEIEFKTHVPKSGELKVQLPDEFQEVDVEVRVTAVRNAANEEIELEDVPLTDEEIKELLKPNPLPASQIIGGGWEHKGITDSQHWVEERRRKEREQRGW